MSIVEFFSRSCSLTRSPAAVVTRKSSSLVVHAGEHLFKVVGHSKLTDSNSCLTSQTFRVGGHDWAILYYPNGVCSIVDGQFSSVFLKLVSTIDTKVTTTFSFSLQDLASPLTGDKNKTSSTRKFLPSMTGNDKTSGWLKFVRRSDLAASGCLENDCIVIRCTILVHTCVDDDGSVKVPPSDISNDTHYLLESGLNPDLTVRVGSSKSFKVHGCMLAARSPVFRAQLCGSMTESKQSSINIDDMDAEAFEILLYYIYNDCLPEYMDETTQETTNMAQHLLVAADLYSVDRLKLICESKLSEALAVNTVGFILDLAEQYRCQQLKAHCINYIQLNAERMRAIEDTEGFGQLKHNHPLLVRQILRMGPQRRKNNKNGEITGTS
ncbi:hypothetical protein ACQ4PT_000871 [Festuca glaucescens]